jgi:hypothetical protein
MPASDKKKWPDRIRAFSKKGGQGPLEYLLMIAGAILVTTVVLLIVLVNTVPMGENFLNEKFNEYDDSIGDNLDSGGGGDGGGDGGGGDIVCGNGVCEIGEDALSCDEDCTVCGDGQCTGNENALTCEEDCTTCGDGYCTGGEDSLNCSVDCGGSLNFATDSLPNGYETIKYSVSLEATGGTPPYSWSSSALPDGLFLDSVSGVISGTPVVAGEYPVVITVTDNDGGSDEKPLSLTVAATESSPGTIFVPDSFVPLSPFIEANPGSDPYAIILPVRSDILSFASNSGLSIQVVCSSGTIAYSDPSALDETGGLVVLETTQTGDCAVVGDSDDGFFENDFPIVTHWNQNLNAGKGGFEPGSADSTPVFGDSDVLSPYSYSSDFAPFSDDPDTILPGYEQYIAENFATGTITGLQAVTDSDTVLQETGFPVVHKNYPWALDTKAPIEKQVRENIPAFQIAHAYLIAVEPDKSSLATFILPPFWNSNPSTKYPVLFNGFYDIHSSSYAGYAVKFMNIIGRAVNNGTGTAMGALWNGGGASVSIAQSRSAYDNASLLFSTAESLLGADTDKVVAIGGSRGAHTALMVASNPYHDNYSVKFALAMSPPIKFGDHALDYSDTTYNAVLGSVSGTDGYKYAWQIGWVDPVTGLTGRELFLRNLLNTTDKSTANNLGIWSDTHINSLKNRGTKVLLTAGSNDHFMPLNIEVEYAQKLKEMGVPVRFELNYRFGHGGIEQYEWETFENAVTAVLKNEEVPLEEGIFHYRRESEENYQNRAPFFPASQPIVLEAPKLVAFGERNAFVFVGGPNVQINLKVYKIDDNAWLSGSTIVKDYQDLFLSQSVTLPASTYPISTAVNHLTIPTDGSVASGFYIYELYFARPGETLFTKIPASAIPQPSAPPFPVLQVIPSEVATISGSQMIVLSEDGRAWGLSSDTID